MRRFELEPAQASGELSIRRSITISPKQGGTVILRTRPGSGPGGSKLTTGAQIPVKLAA
jgi:hypothetical protein